MKVPSSLLRQTITIQPFLGTGAYGPRWGDEVTVKARVEGKRRTVRRPDGTDVISTASATIRPDLYVDQSPGAFTDTLGTPVPLESKATWEGRDYTVVDVIVGQGLTRAAYWELMLA